MDIIYGCEEDNMILICFVLLLVDVMKIIWRGFFYYMIYFINEKINLKINWGDCLFVILNVMIGIYNFVIMNLNWLEDEGLYFCFVSNLSIFEELFVNIVFYGILYKFV